MKKQQTNELPLEATQFTPPEGYELVFNGFFKTVRNEKGFCKILYRETNTNLPRSYRTSGATLKQYFLEPQKELLKLNETLQTTFLNAMRDALLVTIHGQMLKMQLENLYFEQYYEGFKAEYEKNKKHLTNDATGNTELN